ncbi:MAG: hypothetical protein LBU48_00785, partial [Coriobacteriales bacterium]|nr:hypothetical protein [Coriobacteriales bacterium]
MTAFVRDDADNTDVLDEGAAGATAPHTTTGDTTPRAETLAADAGDAAPEPDLHIPEILLAQRKLTYHADSVSIVLVVRINCPSFCDLSQASVQLQSSTGDAWEIPITRFNGVENETDEFTVTTGCTAGIYTWTAFFHDRPANGPAHAKVAHTYAFTYAPHSVSLAVWGIPFPATAGSTVPLFAGAKCNNGCSLAGQEVRLLDGDGELLASGTLGNNHWEGSTGTTDLLWTELELEIPP